MPGIEPATVEALADDLIESSRPGDEARTISTENLVSINSPAEKLIAGCLGRSGLPADADTIRRLRRAMSIPVSDRMKPLPGAVELLATIHQLGMRTIIASNTYWRDAESYWEDFRLLGMAEHVDDIVTSVDAGHLKPQLSCLLLPIQVQGRAITTVEGLARGSELHPLQQAFAELGAAQCGYCTPGILLAASSLLDENAAPTREEIREALAGNLCRCTGYTKILQAIELAASRMT